MTFRKIEISEENNCVINEFQATEAVWICKMLDPR